MTGRSFRHESPISPLRSERQQSVQRLSAPCQTKCRCSLSSRGKEKKKGGRSRPCFSRNCANCSGVACSPSTATAGSPGTSSIKSVTRETTVQTTSNRISRRRRRLTAAHDTTFTKRISHKKAQKAHKLKPRGTPFHERLFASAYVLFVPFCGK